MDIACYECRVILSQNVQCLFYKSSLCLKEKCALKILVKYHKMYIVNFLFSYDDVVSMDQRILVFVLFVFLEHRIVVTYIGICRHKGM